MQISLYKNTDNGYGFYYSAECKADRVLLDYEIVRDVEVTRHDLRTFAPDVYRRFGLYDCFTELSWSEFLGLYTKTLSGYSKKLYPSKNGVNCGTFDYGTYFPEWVGKFHLYYKPYPDTPFEPHCDDNGIVVFLIYKWAEKHARKVIDSFGADYADAQRLDKIDMIISN
jgi:hypothetical protein